jgi:starch synthase
LPIRLFNNKTRMIQVLHISAECYPAAKTGGLGDVVGSLPKYLSTAGVLSGAIIPKYSTKWINQADWVMVYGGEVWVNWRKCFFTVQQHRDSPLGYPLFVVDMPGLFDRPGIYNDPSGAPYGDELTRSVGFQMAVLDWLLSFPWGDRPRVLHCHDHHTGLIPWMVKYCPAYQQLAPIPTVFTIHNGQYQGAFGWRNADVLPPYDPGTGTILDWNGIVNPMAGAIKSAWAVTTVSNSYLYELHQSSLGLESLFRAEWRKEWGIVNGIDAAVWDPATDPMIQHRLAGNDIDAFKAKNKAVLCEWFGLNPDWPLVSYIGRMVGEKGSDLLPEVYKRFLQAGARVSFLVLGTGEAWTQDQFRAMAQRYEGRLAAVIDYNEALSHQIYAGSDFLIMPSRVEPCGLNQLYSMRYGTLPIVRSVGGLKDTVPDIGEPDGNGRGIRFDQFNVEDAAYAVFRAVSMWHNDPSTISRLRQRIMAVDSSWENAIGQYLQVYRSLGAKIGDDPVVPIEETKATPAPKKAAAAKPAALVVEKAVPAPKKAAAAKPAAPVVEKATPAPKKAAAAKPAAPVVEKATPAPKKAAAAKPAAPFDKKAAPASKKPVAAKPPSPVVEKAAPAPKKAATAKPTVTAQEKAPTAPKKKK